MRKHTPRLTMLLFCCLVCSIQGNAQELPLPVSHLPFQEYTSRDGLSQSLTQYIAQDHQGNIWVAGREGINRFDGLEFENHITNPDFPDDIIVDIQFDEQGHTWVLGKYNLYCFRGDTVKSYRTPNAEAPDLQQLHLHTSDSIFITTWRDTYPRTLLFTGDTIVFYDPWKVLPDRCRVPFIAGLPDNGKLIITQEQEGPVLSLFRFDPNGQSRKLEVDGQQDFKMADFNTLGDTVIVRLEQSIYAFLNDSLHLLLEVSFPFTNYLVRSLNDIYVATPTSLFRFQHGQPLDFGLRWNRINKIFLDREKRLWITAEEGLFKLENEAILHFPDERGMLHYTWTILQDSIGNMWFASYRNGMKKLDLNQQYHVISEFPYTGEEPMIRFYTGGAVRFNGDLLFTAHGAIHTYNPEDGFSTLKGTETGYPTRAYQDIKQHDSILYIATKGLYIQYPNDRSAFFGNEEGLDMLRYSYLESVELDTNQTVWMGSHFGLARMDWNTKEITNFYLDSDIPAGINHIQRDAWGNVWFGTHKGLSLYRYQSELPESVLPDRINTSVKFIRQIDSTWLMLGMLHEVLLLNLQKFYAGETHLISLDEETGFDAADCIQASGFIDQKGHVWVATRTGVLKISPEKLDLDMPQLNIQFTHLAVKSLRQQKWHTQHIDSATFSFRSTDQIQINYKVITHKKPQKVRYEYRLLGYNDNWSVESPLRYAYFANLPVGNYTFEVRPCLEGTCYESARLLLEVRAGVWFDSPYFRFATVTSLILLLAGILYLWYRENKEKQLAIQLQNELTKKELAQLRLKQQLILSQTEPHFIFNSLNAIVGLIASQSKELAIEYLGMFSELFRKVLTKNPRATIPLKEELAFVHDYLKLEKLRFGDRFNFEISIDEQVNLRAPIPRMLIQLFANNAVKHGLEPKKTGDGKLDIALAYEAPFIHITLADNGVGRSAPSHKKTGTGTGMQIAQASIDWFNQQNPVESTLTIEDLYDENQQPLGTQVVIYLFFDSQNPNHEGV